MPETLRILHTEASMNWGGQELRIYHELVALHERGHQLFFAADARSLLYKKVQELGFVTCLNTTFNYRSAFAAFQAVRNFIKCERIDLCVTHSSKDAWIGGAAARKEHIPVIRVRHLSAHVRRGLNSILLYNALSDVTICTCQEVAERLQSQAYLPARRICSIPTGIQVKGYSPKEWNNYHASSAQTWRKHLEINAHDVVIGTVCVLRSWKGIEEFLLAAAQLLDTSPHSIRWIVTGGGVNLQRYRDLWAQIVSERWPEDASKLGALTFTGHVEKPLGLMAAMDIFCLLSRANEGVSQAAVQAASLGKPLICTPTGGLKELCIEGETGILVPVSDATATANAMAQLTADPHQRTQMGKHAQALAWKSFNYETTLEKTLAIYRACLRRKK